MSLVVICLTWLALNAGFVAFLWARAAYRDARREMERQHRERRIRAAVERMGWEMAR